VAIALLGIQIRCGGGGSSVSTPVAPSIASFVANPVAIMVGGTAQISAVFANGTGVITPGNLPAASGVAVNVTPAATTSYTLTVTGTSGASVTQDAGVTVVPAGAAVITPNSVQASGGQQTTAGGALGNGVVVGQSFPSTVSTSPSGTLQVQDGYLPTSN
jgi:hypothetical protein